ncbi:MAG: transketolase [Saprospiraceae bacterium]|nr:transketolase [Saprospiraceae bacterium]MDW8230669.1 transketolase [Saprospiraceae bacterium]
MRRLPGTSAYLRRMKNQQLKKIAHTLRGLAIDAVEAANSGHPGMPLGMADVAAVLWSEFLQHNPTNPSWANRDRFVLSAGHGSMLLYGLLHLYGYDLPLDELRRFRQWGSRTAGHPEYGHAPGIETTTGPLGQGIANAVGMAWAEKHLAARFNKGPYRIVDHYTYVIASDGDLQEGISHEACSFAGHHRLSKLIVLYDDNGISIDGHTELSFSENVLKRFTAYGWSAYRVDGHDYDAIRAAITLARASDKPTIIACRTLIGYGSPNKAGTEEVHGAPLGKEEALLTKKKLGLPTDKTFYISEEVLQLTRKAVQEGQKAERLWQETWEKYQVKYPALAAEYEACRRLDVPAEALELPPFPAGKMATRIASGKVLDAIAPHIPALVGGSADLTPSNKTFAQSQTVSSHKNPAGNYLHYGVREHAMAALMNGMALHGGILPYGGTFFVFTDYMRPSMRLAALMGLRVIYVLTHDSIGLGEDGPTHQPIEHLASLRAMPNLSLIRPMDANETVVAWQMALRRTEGPTALILTRQNLPVYDRVASGMADARGAERGAYVLVEDADFQVILIASGSEVEIALNARQLLRAKGIGVRVVSMPSMDVFEKQEESYRQQVLPARCPLRVAVEAGASFGWHKYVGPKGVVVGLDHFGASAPYEDLYRHFGLTAERVAAQAEALAAKH